MAAVNASATRRRRRTGSGRRCRTASCTPACRPGRSRRPGRAATAPSGSRAATVCTCACAAGPAGPPGRCAPAPGGPSPATAPGWRPAGRPRTRSAARPTGDAPGAARTPAPRPQPATATATSAADGTRRVARGRPGGRLHSADGPRRCPVHQRPQDRPMRRVPPRVPAPPRRTGDLAQEQRRTVPRFRAGTGRRRGACVVGTY
jgi:hypothetical protein